MPINGYGTTENNPNFLGVLFEIGQNATPLLNMVGGLNGARSVSTRNFAMSTNYELNAASQPSISEDDSVAGKAPVTYEQTQKENATQIFQYTAQLSYANQSDVSTLEGVPGWQGNNEVTDKMGAQVARSLRQAAVDTEYTMFNGVYAKWDTSGTASQSRGISSALSTNVIDGTAGLTKDLFNSLTRSMADNGAELDNSQCVIFVNSEYKQALSQLFALQERNNEIGGVAVDTILTDFGELAVQYAPQVVGSEILIADMSKISLAVMPTKGQPILVEEIAKVGASDARQIYMQAGTDYSNEIFHGKINNLPVT